MSHLNQPFNVDNIVILIAGGGPLVENCFQLLTILVGH
jgi:hypothetical protein